MQFHSLLAAALAAFMMACEQNDPPPNIADPVVVQNQVTEDLATQDNLSEFVAAFNALELSSDDVAEGITIFAPLDGANSANGRSASDTTALTSEVLKDHIVKTVINAADLNDGDTLTTLGGQALEVNIEGEEIRINGVLLLQKNIATNEKYIVHTVEEILTNKVAQSGPGTIEITVWNGAKWAPDKPKGELEAGVTVSLYNSREDFMQGNPAAYTSETGADGKVTFTNINSDKVYYVAAMKYVFEGTISNSFYVEKDVQNGVFTGMVYHGIFQSQEEVDSYIEQPDAAPGNFRWKDVNADGLIDTSDRLPIPHQEVAATAGHITAIDITIGHNDNWSKNRSILNKEEAIIMLQTVYRNLIRWQSNFIMADGILSNDTDECYMLCTLDGFTIAANDPIISVLWLDAYKNITYLNRLIHDVPELSFTEKDNVVAEAEGLRAFIYLKLVTYFGDIPLQTGLTLQDGVTRTPAGDVYAFIEEGLQKAKATLPSQWPSAEIHRFSSHAATALLAKVALQQEKWQEAVIYTKDILNSGRYTYMDNNTLVFDSYENSETIWNNFAFGFADGWFKDYFFEYSREHYPTVRLTEVYLMNVEAQIELVGLTGETFNNLNTVRLHNGLPTVAATSTREEVRAALRATWNTVMAREGDSFANLVRWEMAQDILGPKGYQPHHALLPIPQVIIDKNPNILQNPGY